MKMESLGRGATSGWLHPDTRIRSYVRSRHYVPGAPGYVDVTAVNPYNVEKAKALLKEAGVATPLELAMPLAPPPYARQGGEVIAAQLAKIGINVKMQNVEWAQWLSGVYEHEL